MKATALDDESVGPPKGMAPGLGTVGGAPTDADSQAKPTDTSAPPVLQPLSQTPPNISPPPPPPMSQQPTGQVTGVPTGTPAQPWGPPQPQSTPTPTPTKPDPDVEVVRPAPVEAKGATKEEDPDIEVVRPAKPQAKEDPDIEAVKPAPKLEEQPVADLVKKIGDINVPAEELAKALSHQLPSDPSVAPDEFTALANAMKDPTAGIPRSLPDLVSWIMDQRVQRLRTQTQVALTQSQIQQGQPAGSEQGQSLAIPQPTPAGPTTTEQPPEAAQPSISSPPPANLPVPQAQQQPLTVPTPTPESSAPDPHELQQVLKAQGISPGAAQAIAAGQPPATISGDKPAPPKLSQPAPPPPLDTLGKLGDEDLINQVLAEKPTSATTQPQPESMEAAQARYEAERAKLAQQPPAAPDGSTQAAPVKPTTTLIPAVTGSYTPSTDRSIQGIVIHSSDGNEKSDINTLTGHDPSHRVSSHYYVTQDGRVYQFVADGDIAFHAGQTSGKYAGYNNANTIGIEQEHVDGQPWSEAEVKATAGLVAYLQKKYGLNNSNTLGHSDIAPERKQDPYNYPWDRFHQYVQTAGGATDKGGPVALAPTTPLSKEDSAAVDELGKAGLHVTRYGYASDPYLDSESKAGHGKYVADMKPGYDVALNNAAWELVGKPEPGSVFTYAGKEWRYGDKVPEKYTDPRFDIYDPKDEFAAIGGASGGKAIGSKGGDKDSGDVFAGQPLFSIGSKGGGDSAPRQSLTPPFSEGRDSGSSRTAAQPEPSVIAIAGGGGDGRRGGGGDEDGGGGGGGAPSPRYQPQQMSVDTTADANPMVAALINRGFTPQQALNYAQGVQNIAPGKGIGPLNQPPPAPSAAAQLPGQIQQLRLTLSQKQPVTPQLLSAKQLMPGKVPKIDPSVVLGLMKKGFTREQAIAVAGKATVTPGIGQTASFRPSQAPAAPGKTIPTGPAIQLGPPAPPAPAKPAAKAPQQQPQQAQGKQPATPQPQSQQPPGPHEKAAWFQTAKQTMQRLRQESEAEPTEFTGRPAGSTHGDPNPPGMDALTGALKDQGKQHKALLSADDPRVSKQADNFIKGEHFVEGDPYHDQLLNGLPYGKQGPQRQKLREGETAIADKTPMHISYISSPKELEKFPTRESRRIQYDKSSPEARLMDATEGALVGHSMIPLNVGIKLPTKKEEKAGDTTHQGYLQGISTNVMANNFQHLNDKLAAMGRKTPYPKLGAKFANDLEGYYHNLLAGHTATGSGYTVGTDAHPNEPDRTHVPYMLTRKEADFIGAVINNTAAFAQHEDGQKIRELARANGTLITEKGETNRLLHDIEQADPGWSGRGSGKQGRVLEPSIKTFKTGLIHEIHPTEQHLPDTIRPGKEYQQLTKALARIGERGRPDIAIGASLHHTFQDNAAINKIERDFSEHKIDEAAARERIKALGEDPEDYRFIGGSGGLITPYEDDPEAITPEEHTQMKDNLRQQWVGGKLGVDDYRKKAAEVPLPSKPSKPAAPKPVTFSGTTKSQSSNEPGEAPKPPKITVEPEEPTPKPIVPAPKQKPPKPQTEPEESEAPAPKPIAPKPQEKPETPPAAPSAPPSPKPQPKPKTPEPEPQEAPEPSKEPSEEETSAPKKAPAPDEPLPEPTKKPAPEEKETPAPSASHYVSPNVKEGTDLAGALKQAQSAPHKKARDFYQKVEDAYRPGGGGKVTPTIGNWEGTKEGSSWTHDDKDTLEDGRVKAALKGLHSAQKGTAVFHHHDDGPDFHYDIDLPNHSHEEADKLIAKHGFSASTIYKEPKGGLRAHLIDPGGENHEHAKQLAAEAKSKSPVYKRGTAAFDGGDDRAGAADAYRKILAGSGIQIRGGQRGLSLRGHGAQGQHPLQPLYEEAEDSFAQHQKGIAQREERAKEEEEEKKKEQDRVEAAQDRANISPERQAGMARLNKKAKAVVKQEGGIQGLDPVSMHAHLTGQRTFPGKLKNEHIGEYYDANNPKLDYENEEHRERVSHAVYHDIVHSLAGTTTGGKPSEAYGWYDETVKKSLNRTGEIAPKILTDPLHELAWKLMLAVTSQGQDVYPNAESTWHGYRHWIENGAKEGGLPESREIFGGGLKAEQMEDNFKKINVLWKELGTEKFKKLLMKRMTVGQLKKEFPGLDVPGELAHHTVNGAMFMGPKIGAFFSNLYGDYEPTTMDLWFSRNMNLMAGNMFKFSDEATRVDRIEKGKLVKSHLSQLKDALDSGLLTSVDQDQAKKMSAELSALMAHPEGKLDRPTARALAPTIYDWAREQHKAYQRSYGSEAKDDEEKKGSYHEDFKTPENLTAKKLDENTSKLSDAPRNGAEREQWRDIMRRATDKLKKVGLKLVNADKQALLWFVIKDLFRKAGSPQRDKADYLDAAYTLVRKVKEGTLPSLNK